MSDDFCQELTIVQAKVDVDPPALNLKAPETGLNPMERNVIVAIANWAPKETTDYELSWSSLSQAGTNPYGRSLPSQLGSPKGTHWASNACEEKN